MLKGKKQEAIAVLVAAYATASDAFVTFARDLIAASGKDDDYATVCDEAEAGISALIDAGHVNEGSRRMYRARLKKAIWMLGWQTQEDEAYAPPRNAKLFDLVKEYDSLYPTNKPVKGTGKTTPKFIRDFASAITSEVKARGLSATQTRDLLAKLRKELDKIAPRKAA